MRQDAISLPDESYLDWASVGCNECIWVKAQGGRCDKTSDSSLAELLLDDGSLTIRQSGVVEGGAPLDALSEPSSDRNCSMASRSSGQMISSPFPIMRGTIALLARCRFG